MSAQTHGQGQPPDPTRGRPASLDNAIGYEVERLFPFPKDELYYDYLTHPVGGEAERIGVTLFCLRRSEVEDLLSVLSSLALRPHMVTISSCAQMSALLRACRRLRTRV